MQAGSVHSSFTAQAQHVLQGDDAEACCRAKRCSNECPMDTIVAASDVGLGVTAFVLSRARIPPSHHRIVVVSAGINDFAVGAVRQVHVRTLITEAKL